MIDKDPVPQSSGTGKAFLRLRLRGTAKPSSALSVNVYNDQLMCAKCNNCSSFLHAVTETAPLHRPPKETH